MRKDRNGFLEIENLDFDCLIKIPYYRIWTGGKVYQTFMKIFSFLEILERISISVISLRTELPVSKKIKQ